MNVARGSVVDGMNGMDRMYCLYYRDDFYGLNNGYRMDDLDGFDDRNGVDDRVVNLLDDRNRMYDVSPHFTVGSYHWSYKTSSRDGQDACENDLKHMILVIQSWIRIV